MREVFTLAQRPDLEARVRRLDPETLPEFMLHDAVANRYWGRLYSDFPGFQVAVCESGEVAAAGHTIPVSWDAGELPDEGFDAALEQGMRDLDDGRPPAVLCALQAVVGSKYQRRGLSRVVLKAMRNLAREHGLETLIAPVRPTLKSRYPLTPMERYARWRRDDGSLFDPWMRVHERLGAALLKVAPGSMRIAGTVAEWEKWTGMSFPESGEYVVPGALRPVVVDREKDLGLYEEPNVWMRHRVPGG